MPCGRLRRSRRDRRPRRCRTISKRVQQAAMEAALRRWRQVDERLTPQPRRRRETRRGCEQAPAASSTDAGARGGARFRWRDRRRARRSPSAPSRSDRAARDSTSPRRRATPRRRRRRARWPPFASRASRLHHWPHRSTAILSGVLLFVVHPASTRSEVDTVFPLKVVALIPARYASTRLPGKVLADLDGRPMIEHVYRRASMSPIVADTIVATDDLRIAKSVTTFGGKVRLTKAHETGTDRLAEVAASLDCDVVVNVQGDEPLIDPGAITELVTPFRDDPGLQVTTL